MPHDIPATFTPQIFRAGHAGSFLRPGELMAACEQCVNGVIDARALRRAADRHY